jgi:hypothetical protein
MKTESSLVEDMPPLINENHSHTINIPNHEHEWVRPWFGPQRFTQVLEVYGFDACAIRHIDMPTYQWGVLIVPCVNLLLATPLETLIEPMNKMQIERAQIMWSKLMIMASPMGQDT